MNKIERLYAILGVEIVIATIELGIIIASLLI